MEKQELIEKVVNNLVIHHWGRQTNKGKEFNCDYWDCPKKIKTGDKYYVELYPDGHTLSYCLECSAFFISQVLNALLDQPIVEITAHRTDNTGLVQLQAQIDAEEPEVKGWEDTVLTLNQWLDVIGCDRAYRKDMKETYQKSRKELAAQAKATAEAYEGKVKEVVEWVEHNLIYIASDMNGVLSLHLQTNEQKSAEKWQVFVKGLTNGD